MASCIKNDVTNVIRVVNWDRERIAAYCCHLVPVQTATLIHEAYILVHSQNTGCIYCV